MTQDVRGTATWTLVEEHFTRLHEPAFGQASRALEPTATGDGLRIAVTGMVLDKLEGLPRQAVYAVEDGRLRVLTSGAGSSRLPRFSPDGRSLAFLSDRSEPGRFQLFLLPDGHFGEALATPRDRHRWKRLTATPPRPTRGGRRGAPRATHRRGTAG